MAQALTPRRRPQPEPEQTVQVELKAKCWINVHCYPPGATVEVPKSLADALVEAGTAILSGSAGDAPKAQDHAPRPADASADHAPSPAPDAAG